MTAARDNVVPLRGHRRETERLSDEAVAIACAARDPAAVADLFDRFEPVVTRFLRRLVWGIGDVEDLVQATFLAVAEGKATYQGRGTVRSWLLGVAANKARQHHRVQARRRRLENAIALVRRATRPAEPARLMEVQDSAGRAQRALEGLPAHERVAFVLCEVEGLSAKEAGAALGVGEAAVWKRVSRARRRLRAELSPADEEAGA